MTKDQAGAIVSDGVNSVKPFRKEFRSDPIVTSLLLAFALSFSMTSSVTSHDSNTDARTFRNRETKLVHSKLITLSTSQKGMLNYK